MSALPFIAAAVASLTAGYAVAAGALLAPDIRLWWRRLQCVAAVAREIAR